MYKEICVNTHRLGVMPTRIVVLVLLVVYSALFLNSYLVHFSEVSYPLFDDGMITLEYAKNFAREGNLTVGGGDAWTAGFTSWAWMLLLSLLSLVPVSDLHLPMLVPFFNFAILVIALWVVSRISRDLIGRQAPQVYWFLVLTAPSILFWTLRGMEVPLALLAVALLCDSTISLSKHGPVTKRPIAVFLIMSACIPFVRPELAAPLVACASYLYLRGDKDRKLIAGLAILVLAVGFFAYVQLNLMAFNQQATNSFFLKISGVSLNQKLERGVSSIGMQLKHNWIYVVASISALIWVVEANRKHHRSSGLKPPSIYWFFRENNAASVIAVVICTIVASWILVGGDAWEELPVLNRFIVVCVPLVSLMAAAGVANSSPPTRRPLVLVTFAFVALNVFFSIQNIGLGAFNDRKFSYIGYTLGEKFGNTVKAMHYWYGQPSYFSSVNGGVSIDALGKIDSVVSQSPPMLSFKPGHDRWNHAHSIGILKPDIIVNMPCPSPHDLKFDCSKVWDEITGKFGYKPHTAPNGEVTLFVSPRRPDLDAPIEQLEHDLVGFTQEKAKAKFWLSWY